MLKLSENVSTLWEDKVMCSQCEEWFLVWDQSTKDHQVLTTDGDWYCSIECAAGDGE